MSLSQALNQFAQNLGRYRTLIFVPYVVSEVIVGTGWSLLLQKKGAINEILANFGINGPDWVVPEKLRTLDHGRPWSDDQFASTRLSSNRDMSR